MIDFEDAVRQKYEPLDVYEFCHRAEGTQTVTTVDCSSCFEVVHSFYHFMLASGFHSSSVLSALDTVYQEFAELKND
jgi:hypothetical protein